MTQKMTTSGTGYKITNNIVRNTDGYGISLTHIDDFAINDNTVTGNKKDGIHCSNCGPKREIGNNSERVEIQFRVSITSRGLLLSGSSSLFCIQQLPTLQIK